MVESIEFNTNNILSYFRLTKRLSNSDVVTLAVFLLGGRDRYVDTEDVAMKAEELAPGRFTWRKYPQQINLELVRVHLSEVKGDSHGSLLRGSGVRGWTLTSNGLTWALRNASSAEPQAQVRRQNRDRGGSVDTKRMDREKSRITSTSAWRKWPNEAASITRIEAEQIFRLDSHATAELRSEKIERLKKTLNGVPELESFIEFVARKIAQ